MENLQLVKAQQQQLAKRLPNLEPVETLTESIGDVVSGLREGYGLPKLFAHQFQADMWLGLLDDNQPDIKAVSQYQGETHHKLFGHVVRISNRLHRQEKEPRKFLALMVAEDLLRSQINFRADLARAEAVAGFGELAYDTPSKDIYDKIEKRLCTQAVQLNEALNTCQTAEDLILVFCGRVAERLAGRDTRVRDRLENFQTRARRAGHGALLFQLQKVEQELDQLRESASVADPMDPDAIGKLVHRRYGIITRNPGVFGLEDPKLMAELNRPPRRAPRKGRKGKGGQQRKGRGSNKPGSKQASNKEAKAS